MNVTLLPSKDYCYITVQAVNFRIRNAVLVFKKDVGCRGMHAGAFSPVFYLFTFWGGGQTVRPAGRQRIVMPLRVTWIVMEACWRRRTTWWICAVCVCVQPVTVQISGGPWRRLTREKWRYGLQRPDQYGWLKGRILLNKIVLFCFYVSYEVYNKVVINFYMAKWSFFNKQILIWYYSVNILSSVPI